jgi:alpha-L-fucosidase 2
MQCGGIGVGSTLDFACGGWTAQLYWLYYKYTLDENFLKKRALPFIKGVMRVFEETLEERDEKLSIPLSISAEYGCTFKVKKDGRYVNQSSGRDPSNQLSCMHMLADMLLEASEITGRKPKSIWQDIKLRLPQYTLTGEPDNRHIAIWEGQDLDVCHRHHSHLACIYPFDTLSAPDHEQQEILDNSIDHWILRGMGQWSEWCYPWAAIIQARLGFKEAPAILLNLWREIFINKGWATAYLPRFQGLTAHRRADMLKPRETNEVMQLDGTMAGATAIIEMLVHQRGDTVYLFKGVPDKWLDIHFKDIRLPGAFIISAARKNGKLESVRVKSVKGGILRIKLEDRETQQISFKPSQEQELIIPVCDLKECTCV